ncbi:hypothetical protein BJ508DRAFT_304277 [Ascobolus immersus RN42]|uniref:Uncharacterized protein n=1 Tax=Ascobolus immersus RN42 TaxID=1160509 RepID=A0A3N4ICB7_ASCIM|nr:hypothetical protein BJ508DRAFT_304277 [Ascobolus immersus RN42]
MEVLKIRKPYIYDQEAQAKLVDPPTGYRISVFRPICHYVEKDHAGTLPVFYSSNDNDLSCVATRFPPTHLGTARPSTPIKVQLRMFRSFSAGWGPVAVDVDNPDNIIAYLRPENDKVRGLLGGTHRLSGDLAWDSVMPFGAAGTIAFGRVKYTSKTCPGMNRAEAASGATHTPSKTQGRGKDGKGMANKESTGKARKP